MTRTQTSPMAESAQTTISWQCSLLEFLLLGYAEPALVTGIAHSRNRTGDYWRSRPSIELSEFIEWARSEPAPWLEYRALVAGLVLAERGLSMHEGNQVKEGITNEH